MRDWRFEETGGSAGEGEYGEEGTHDDGFVERSKFERELDSSPLPPPHSLIYKHHPEF